MKELEELGLRGNGLISIEHPELVDRYNACLSDMGLKTTDIKKFRIDCMGWSPEIASSQSNNYYLSHGESPFAIILTPKQRYSPIYFPFHSFDWKLMQQWFDAHESQVTELTKEVGIWLDIDQEVGAYEDVADLLMVDDVTVRARTPLGLMQKTSEQKALVDELLRIEDVFQFGQQAQLLVESAKEIGDMRDRNVVIQDMRFTDMHSFFTRAFGGAFVLHSAHSVPESEYFVISKVATYCAKGVQSINDKRILTTLEDLGLISYELKWWREQYYRLEIIRDSFLMDVLDVQCPETDFSSVNPAKKKKIIHEISSDLPDEYFEMNRLIDKLKKGSIPKKVSEQVRPFFAHPSEEVEMHDIEVIWHILTLVSDGRQVEHLYRHDIDEFFLAYDTWKTPKKSWAQAVISKYYKHKMMRY